MFDTELRNGQEKMVYRNSLPQVEKPVTKFKLGGMNMRPIIILSVLILLSACSEEPVALDEHSDLVVLEIQDSIGVESGDANLVFGSIESMCETPDGNIALLDRAYSEVRIFSPDGEYIRTIGGQGSGPGEMNMTIYMGITESGRLFVSQRSGCNEFDYFTGDFITSVNFNGPPPIAITGTTDSTFVAISMEIVETDQGIGIDASVSRFTDGYTRAVAYTNCYFDLNPVDMSNFFQMGWYGYCFDVDRDGNVFIARASDTDYLVTGFTPDGEVFLSITKPVDTAQKTEDEILEEKNFYEARFESLGMGEMPYLPQQNWNTIRTVGVDGQNRIWVLRGWQTGIVFDVYNTDGNEIITAALPYPGSEGRYWRFAVERDFILAWPENPESGYQKFFIIPLPQ